MKKTILIKNSVAILFVLLFLTTSEANAGSLPPGPPQDSENVPLDPFSWVLLATGGAVAAKKYYFDKHKKDDN